MAHSISLKDGHGFRPQKRLGQHFLIDRQIIHKIIRSARFEASDLVLEIGPGQGALTLPLAQSVGQVVAVEKDTYLAGLLKEKLSRTQLINVTLINHDILKLDLNEIKPPSPVKIKVIGNLPYNISSPLLEKLIENRELVSRAVLMFQSEVAERLTASPGGKAYGAMTLLIQYHALPTPLLEVSRKSFYPIPKVDSMVVELDFERPYPRHTIHVDSFKRVVKGAFAYRRKTILNSLKRYGPFWNQDVILKALKSCRIDPGNRAEVLGMEDYLCLADALALTTGPSNDK
ncbi:MAG TPA: 16S rRNA (adenine(1518)-N(6)/adenine(1519)-N(6))-dimethyltransferase RsmA [Acidobacteriota bacterium]|nr:16S rRNA (adenine(1518)-N(6)/adenine(1519)-N(6))-dimethyltransferase RsmA [Acidobacteriota bacterium]